MRLSLLAWCKVDLNPAASRWECPGLESSASHHAPSPLSYIHISIYPLQHRGYKGTGHDPEVPLCCAHLVLSIYLLGLLAAKIIELVVAAVDGVQSLPAVGTHCPS